MSGAIATAAIIGGIGAAGSIGGAAIASSGAKSAAKTQTQAADQAAQLQYQASQNALDFQKQQYNDTQQNAAPWLRSGTGALSNLDFLMGIGPQTSQQFQLGGGMSLPSQPEMGGRTSLDQPFPGQPTANPVGGGTSIAGGSPTLGGSPFSGRPMPMSSPTANPVSPGSSLAGMSGALQSGLPSTPGANPVQGGASLAGASSALSPFGNPSANPISVGGPGMSTGAISLNGSSPFPSRPMPGAVSAGGSALNGPAGGASGGYGSLMTPYQGHFEAPTGLTMQNDPGYQARLQLGTDAIQHSAAARGNILTGGTAKALDTYGQDYGSNEYGNVYNRALTDYQTQYNAYNNDQTNQFNRLAAISGLGQATSNQLATAGQNASNNVSNNMLGTAAAMGQQYNNAAAANASGMVGSANAWGGALGGVGNNLSNLYMLQQLQNGQQMNYNNSVLGGL